MQIITNYNDILAKRTGIFYFPSKALAKAFINEYLSSDNAGREMYCLAIDRVNNIAFRLRYGFVSGYSEIDFYLSPDGIEEYPDYERYEVNYTNKTSNFSEGDFVRIRKDLHRDIYYGGTYVNSNMANIRGSAGIIDSVYSEDDHYSLKGSEWCWNEEMFKNIIAFNGGEIPVNENLVLY